MNANKMADKCCHRNLTLTEGCKTQVEVEKSLFRETEVLLKMKQSGNLGIQITGS